MGTPPPVHSVPQSELLTLNTSDMPILRDALGEGVHYRPLFLDPEHGVWVVLASFEPGAELPIHLHSGSVHGFTIKGRWEYKEYPQNPQTAGSYLYEPGASIHTLHAPATNTETTEVLFIVNGANVNFNEDGQFHSVLDAVTLVRLTEELSKAQGLGALTYLTGGSAGYTSS